MVVPAILLGQATARPQTVRPTTCPASDSLLAPNLERPKASVTAVPGIPPGQVLVTRGGSIPKAGPVKAFMVNAVYSLTTPSPSAELSFQLEVADYKSRSGRSAALMLTLDDSVSLALGEMHGQPNLAIGLPPSASLDLARATTISGLLGDSPFTIDGPGRDAIRAVFIAAVCGLSVR